MRSFLNCCWQFVAWRRLKRDPDLLHVRQERHDRLRQIDSELDTRCIKQAYDRLPGLHGLESLRHTSGDYAIERSSKLRIASIRFGRYHACSLTLRRWICGTP